MDILLKILLKNLGNLMKKKDNNNKFIQNNHFKKYEGTGKISKQPFSIDIGYEIFLGPESFFHQKLLIKILKLV